MTVRASNCDVLTAAESASYSGRSKRTIVAPRSAIRTITPSITWLTSLWRSAVPNRFVIAPMRPPTQGVSAKELRVARRDVTLAKGGDGIGRVVAGHHVEQQCRIRHRACDRADLVLGQAV